MSQAYYCKSIKEFLSDPPDIIQNSLTLGTSKSGFYELLSSQTDSWTNEINVLKQAFVEFDEASSWGILLEYSIPRRSKRIDIAIISDDTIFIIEYKDGEGNYKNEYVIQVEDYCLDLRDFHFESFNRSIVPIVLCPKGKDNPTTLLDNNDLVKPTLFANSKNLKDIISQSYLYFSTGGPKIDYDKWNASKYFPTPTIIEAAKSLYARHSVTELIQTRSDIITLGQTTNAILDAIADARANKKKIICFITGVPGAGKTLAGLNIVHNEEFSNKQSELGVFLSGNSPLVKVLSEALSRDYSKREKISKKDALRKVSTFIHNVHQFIDEYYGFENKLPVDKVLIYDEAQRAWTKEYKYRKSKKTINASEPEILLEIMNRFERSYSVIIALVGGGQEINTGEGGLAEWGKALLEKFSDWTVYISDELRNGDHATGNMKLFNEPSDKIKVIENPNLHLRVSIRSYKGQQLSEWVNLLLLNKPEDAKALLKTHLFNYPIYLTRSLTDAKQFLRNKARGSRRYGLVASSGSKRLRPVGIDITGGLKGISSQGELGAWYLNPPDDIRSSNFLEVVASEFAVQGLELDWTCVAWDADLRRAEDSWDYKSFEGNIWENVKQEQDRTYILNKYRVLLTRAREGMIIWIPEGYITDITRLPLFYDSIYRYLKDCGVNEI